MVTTEERLKILKMIQEGKISAEEGAQLIEALEVRKSSSRSDVRGEVRQGTAKNARWFRVKVTDTRTGKPRVNVRLPIGLINAGIKMGARFSPEVQGLDMDQIMEFINSGEVGQVVDVYDEDDGEHVEVIIE